MKHVSLATGGASVVTVAMLLVAGCGPGYVPRDGVTWDTPDDGDEGTDGTTEVPAEPYCGDGVVDDGEECDDAAPGECLTECMSIGTEDCVDCVVEGCRIPAESCNEEDDDCDDLIDEDMTDCRCTDGGEPWDHEECNDIDDDCNGEVDDGLTDCRCTDEDEPWDHEECNDIDDDCDGEVDEELTDCACTDGGEPWDHEECNDIDDDCNGEVDDTLTDCRCTHDDPLTEELCNRVDDDCDGEVDEDLTDCQCTDGGSPTAEVCDRVDNDCDENVDEENTRVSPPGDCKGFGEACNPSWQECSSELCVGDDFEHYCSELCDPSSPDPPCTAPDYRCYDDPDPTGDDYCRRNYTTCAREDDCGLGETCAVIVADDGATLVTECRPNLGTGTVGGTCTVDDDCTNQLCWRDTFCTEVCSVTSDCGSGSGWECIMISHFESGIRQYIPKCMYPCGDDTDCTVGTLTACQPGATPTGTGGYTGEGYCSILYTGTDRLPTGGDCDHTTTPPIWCEHAICTDSGTGVCTEVCDDDGDCGISGWTCVSSTVTFGAPVGSVAMLVCDPP